MTALATVAGMLPLAFAIGAGSQMPQPLGNRGDRRNFDFDGFVACDNARCLLLFEPRRGRAAAADSRTLLEIANCTMQNFAHDIP